MSKQCFYSNFVAFLQYLNFNKSFEKKTYPHYSHMFRWTCKHVPGARDNDAETTFACLLDIYTIESKSV